QIPKVSGFRKLVDAHEVECRVIRPSELPVEPRQPIAMPADVLALGQQATDLDHVGDDALAEATNGGGVLGQNPVVGRDALGHAASPRWRRTGGEQCGTLCRDFRCRSVPWLPLKAATLIARKRPLHRHFRAAAAAAGFWTMSCSSSWSDLRPWRGHSWRRPACPPTRPRCCGAPSRMQADLAPTTGDYVQKLVTRIYATPRPVVERVKKLLAP